MTTNVPSVTLNNGVEMPILGFGVYQVPPEEHRGGRRHGPRGGVPAHRHGRVLRERGGGRPGVVQQWHPARGVVRHDEVVDPENPGEARAKAAFEGSLERLGLGHVDLYLIHQPFGDYYSFWRAMEQVYADGLARAIGVANFYSDRLVDLIEHNEVTPAVNQIETNPFFQRHTDQELMRSHGVQLESWGGFAEGRNNLFTDPTLTAIGDAHGKSVAQVVLRAAHPARHRDHPEASAVSAWNKTWTCSTSPWPTTRCPAHRHHGHWGLAVLRPSRPGDGQLAQQSARHVTPRARRGSRRARVSRRGLRPARPGGRR